jgi:hypothetical protein
MTDSIALGIMGEIDPDEPKRWRFVRPTTIPWNDFLFRIKPIAGQPIRIRESVEIQFTLTTFPTACHIWLNRYYNEAFIGHFQITRLNSNDADTGIITERGQIIGNSNNTTNFKWVFQREYDLNLYIKRNDLNPASLSAIFNCNADLAPGAVENRNINYANVDKYVRIAYALSTGDLANAGTLIDSLTLPAIAGYRFPNTVLFRAVNQIPTVDLEGYDFSSRLGDIGLWVHPDWTIEPEAIYSAQVINFNTLADTQDQFPDGTTCVYPGGLDFP